MICESQIVLPRLILSLSDALDYVCPEIADHQQRVTYISMCIGKKMGLHKEDMANLFLAGALHDIGVIRAEHRIRGKYHKDLEQIDWHSELGYQLLCSNTYFAEAARAIRYHHNDWDGGRGASADGQAVPMASHIIHLADTIEQAIDRRKEILAQTNTILDMVTEQSDRMFNPHCVRAFNTVAMKEAFWLDCTSKRIYTMLVKMVDSSPIDATNQTIRGIAEIFARVVDAMSRWTATHSAGVAATAVALSNQMRLSMREQIQMRTAGLLHDLGKLSVPPEILDHPGRIPESHWAPIKAHSYHTYRILETTGFPQQIIEWASFHHERLDGTGYPFHLTDSELTLGSRVMAVADVFTALTEVRPYRSGLSKADAVGALNQMVKTGCLDGDVVRTLVKNYETIDGMRSQEQARYADRQKALSDIMTGSKA